MASAPITYEEAVNSDDAPQWKAAMEKEMQALRDNDTWEVKSLPPQRNEVKGRWVYTLKQSKEPGKIQYKARYVAKGFSQIQGVDYDETYSPTTRLTSIRALLQKATNEGLTIHQLDVKGAYLNAPIDTELYLQQPPGYEQTAADGQRLTCHLKKSIYGLKQSGRNWHGTLTEYLKSEGFSANDSDPCVYSSSVGGQQVLILFWVDDILIAAKQESVIDSVKQRLSDRFNMDDRGELQWFLGIDFKRSTNGNYIMSQERYANEILRKYNMAECNPVKTPAAKGVSLEKATDEEHEHFLNSPFPYRQAVGSLIYLMTGTRPDLSWTVSKLSQYLAKPGPQHVSALKRLLRYIKGTTHYALTFTPTDGILTGYADADWAGDTDDRRSTTGYVFTIGHAGAPISWKTRKQPTVALSTTEAEYMAISDATKEMIYLRSFCTSLGFQQPSENELYSDNLSALALTKGGVVQHCRTKHIDVRYHFIREQTNICFVHVPSSSNLADCMTKPLCIVLLHAAVKGLQIEGGC